MSKRLGTPLRKIKKVGVGDDIKVGGARRLTEQRIKDWQRYYYFAIKNHAGNNEAMQQAINAIPLHAMSTTSDHCHVHCSKGEGSSCYHQRAMAMGKPIEVPKTQVSVPKELGIRLLIIFKRLSGTALLKRCNTASTQNTNESFNNLLWSKTPKRIFLSRSSIEIEMAAALAMKEFNQGPLAAK